MLQPQAVRERGDDVTGDDERGAFSVDTLLAGVETSAEFWAKRQAG